MKKLIVSLIAFLLVGLNQFFGQVDTNIVDKKIQANYYANTAIELSNVVGFAYVTPKKKDGSTSFYIQYNHAHHLGIMDDEKTEIWYFMIPEGSKKRFEITGEQISKNNVVYCELCYCIQAGCKPAQSDWIISGKKKCKKWLIQIKRGDTVSHEFTATPEEFEKFPK